MRNFELSESAATGCARASDEFRTFNIQNSTLRIRQINSAIAAKALMNNVGENESIIVLYPRGGIIHPHHDQTIEYQTILYLRPPDRASSPTLLHLCPVAYSRIRSSGDHRTPHPSRAVRPPRSGGNR